MSTPYTAGAVLLRRPGHVRSVAGADRSALDLGRRRLGCRGRRLARRRRGRRRLRRRRRGRCLAAAPAAGILRGFVIFGRRLRRRRRDHSCRWHCLWAPAAAAAAAVTTTKVRRRDGCGRWRDGPRWPTRRATPRRSRSSRGRSAPTRASCPPTAAGRPPQAPALPPPPRPPRQLQRLGRGAQRRL